MLVKSITKVYEDFSKTIVFESPLRFQAPRCSVHNLHSCQICFKRNKHSEVSQSSLQRTRSAVIDYSLANEFDSFVTLTFDPSILNSFDYDRVKKVTSKWLNNVRRHSPDLVYIIVPERHKSGRLHFHALFKNYQGRLKDTGRFSKSGGKVYNIEGWRYGFSTLVMIKQTPESNSKVSSYMAKYITKDLVFEGNKRRYWASRNLKKPVKHYNVHSQVQSHPVLIEDTKLLEYLEIIKSRLTQFNSTDSVLLQDKLKEH